MGRKRGLILRHQSAGSPPALVPATQPIMGKDQKLVHPGTQDHLDYIWIDTCCIDKSSSAELQEAINSMFAWYMSASICYAFLHDLPPLTPDTCWSGITSCRWFTRGWTLQELIAPGSLVFFDSSWAARGTRQSRASEICATTNIDQRILRRDKSDDVRGMLEEISVARRMSWASGRETTRIEDQAYCLLGLFDINMPMLYGEGPKAFARLQQEIIETTDDCSVLAWGFRSSLPSSRLSSTNLLIQLLPPDPLSIFAQSPAQFAYAANWAPGRVDEFNRPAFALGQRGITISLPIVDDPVVGNSHIKYAIIGCTYVNPPHFLALPLIKATYLDANTFEEDQEYVRTSSCMPIPILASLAEQNAKWSTVCIRKPLGLRTAKILRASHPPVLITCTSPSPLQVDALYPVQPSGDRHVTCEVGIVQPPKRPNQKSEKDPGPERPAAELYFPPARYLPMLPGEESGLLDSEGVKHRETGSRCDSLQLNASNGE
ncbi:hypothetical protein QBC35DRAFT_114727 [Podospora australis]|uniref:Heterokaryon incompatibility domain-containing protein n=1 Tax=Podospora australis TaxID=1536484 RepID=A0AAN7ACA3_9PEZI|nr:hypothetical protein QBC35DRAFT_114727 [Podospora australis]